MRILIVTATYPPSVNGVAISLKTQKEELEKKGHQVYVVAPFYRNRPPSSRLISFPSIPNPFDHDYPIIIPWLVNPRLIPELLQKFDLVYFHHPLLIPGLAKFIARTSRCPLVFFYHFQYQAFTRMIFARLIPSKIIFSLTNIYFKNFYNSIDQTIVETPSIYKQLRRWGVKTPIEIIPSVSRIDKVRHQKNIKNILGLDLSKVIIITVSRLSREKNINRLLQIFNTINQNHKYQLVIAGTGPLEKQLRHRYQSNPDIHFLGKIPFEEIANVYHLGDIFAYPSKCDTQAIVILEAMSFSLPIVAFKTPGPQDFVIHQKNGYLAKNNLEFKNFLLRLLTDAELRSDMAQKSKELSKKYTLKNSIDRLEQLFIKRVYENKKNRN